MTKEEKQLLLADLCARLPYRVTIDCEDSETKYTCFLTIGILEELLNGYESCDYKPYLRPMSSMTKEELHEVQEILGKGVEIREYFILSVDSSIDSFTYLELQAVFDWLNSHHFDFRNLIERGLAIDCTGLNVY